ncbi:MAG: hypothetical protein ABII26_03135 [Pseudomonadota bacterium]
MIPVLLLLVPVFIVPSCAVNPVSGRHELMLLIESDKIELGIRIRAAQTDGPLREILRSLGSPGGDLEKLAVLNGRHLEDPAPKSTLLKVIERGI